MEVHNRYKHLPFEVLGNIIKRKLSFNKMISKTPLLTQFYGRYLSREINKKVLVRLHIGIISPPKQLSFIKRICCPELSQISNCFRLQSKCLTF